MVTDSLGYQAIPMGFTGRRFLKNARPAFNWGVRARHSSSIMLKPAENKFNRSGFTRFNMQVSSNSKRFLFRLLPSLHIQNLSNRCRHEYDPSISQIFKIKFLAGFCNLDQLCEGSQESTCAQCYAFLEVRYFDARPVWAASRAFFENWLQKIKIKPQQKKQTRKLVKMLHVTDSLLAISANSRNIWKKNREKTGEQITYLPRHIFEKQTKKLSKWRTLQAVPQQFLPIHGK